MEAWLQQFYAAFPVGPGYYGAIFLIALLESLLVVGMLVPGSLLIVFSGFLAAGGKGELPLLVAGACAGSFAGDLLSFLIGARWGGRLLRSRLLFRYRRFLNRSFRLFRRHGAKSIFFGRFVGFFRPFVPFVAGCARMHVATFIAYAAGSAVLWGLAYPGLGFIFGASWEQVQRWSGRFSLVILLLLGLTVALQVWRWRRRQRRRPRDDEPPMARRDLWVAVLSLLGLSLGGLLMLALLAWWIGG